MRKITTKYILRIFIMIILMYAIYLNIDIDAISTILLKINIFWISQSFLIVIIIRMLMAFRWKKLLKDCNIKTKFTDIITTILISNSIGYIIPGGVGSDIIRWHKLSQKYGNLTKISATIFYDRIIGLGSMLFLSLIACIVAEVNGIKTNIVPVVLCLNILFVIGNIFFYYFGRVVLQYPQFELEKFKKLRNILQKFDRSLKNISNFGNTIFPIFIISILVQLLRCGLFFAIYKSIGTNIDFVYFIIFIPIVFVIMLVPFSIGGLGIRESALIYFFSIVGVSSEHSVSAGLVFHLLQLIALLPGLFLYPIADNKIRIIQNR